MIQNSKDSTKDLARKIINGFAYPAGTKPALECKEVVNYTTKKRARKIIEYCKKYNRLSFLEEKNRESSKWEFAWGEWTYIAKDIPLNGPFIKSNYTKVGFDLTIDIAGNYIDKKLFLIISRHAIERLLTRTTNEFENSYHVRVFLDEILKKIILRCFVMWEENQREGYETINNYFVPLAMESCINIRGEESRSFTIKTIMPISFKSAQKSILNILQSNPKKSIFDYKYIFENQKLLYR